MSWRRNVQKTVEDIQATNVCPHRYKVVGVSYMGRLEGQGPFKFRGVSEALVREYLYGVTTLTQQCTLCGYSDTTRHLGQIDVPGFTWRE
jgi:hypothetical protein